MIYLFNKDEDLIKIIPRDEVISAISTTELNKVISIDITFRNIEYEVINKSEYIGHMYDDNFYMYRIIRNAVDIDSSSIKGIHVVFDELKSNGYIRDKRIKNLDVSVLNTILEGTRWEIGKVNSNKKGSTSWYDISKLDALNDFINKWNVELDYRLQFDGSKIVKRYIDVYDKLGDDTGIRLVYGTNAISTKLETTKYNIYTALIGRGKGEEKQDENGDSTGGYGRRINFKDVEWSVSNGDPIDKPNGQEYVELKDRTKLFGFSNGKPRIKIVIFENCDNKEELLKLTYNKLLEISRPQVTFESEVYKIGNVNIGDTVRIIRRDLNIFYNARIFKIERNLVNNDFTKVTLGDYIPSNKEKNRVTNKKNVDILNVGLQEVNENIGTKINNLITDLKNGMEIQYFNDNAYNYELSNNNKWKLPAGYYSFDKPIDKNPSKVIFMGSGKIMIANRKRSDGSWDWSTFGTGDGFVADMITSGHMKGSLIEADSITSEQIAANTITATNIKTNAITGNELAFRTITGYHIDANTIAADNIKANSITGDKLAYRTITGYHIDANTIAADNIRANTITANNIQNNTITSSEISRGGVTGSNVAYKTLGSQHINDITVDILRPGSNNRIVFEGNSPGDNNCLSIDATGGSIRLKADANNYVKCDRWGTINFFTSGGATSSRGNSFVASDFVKVCDVRLKENISYLDHDAKIKPNSEVKIKELKSEDIYNFIKEIQLATYNYLFDNENVISMIAQNIEKYDAIKDYLVRKVDKNKYISQSNLLSMSIATIKELIKKVESLESKIKDLKKEDENES